MELVGYRVIRQLRANTDRSVFAVFGDAALEATVGHSATTCADEANALAALQHPHIAAVVDVATVNGEPVLVKPYYARTLADWLLARGSCSRGELTTLLVPLLSAFAHAHQRGVTSVQCDMQAIGIDDDGTPILLGTNAQLHDVAVTDAWLDECQAVAMDRQAVLMLSQELCASADLTLPPVNESAIEAGNFEDAASAMLESWPATPLHLHERAVAPAVERRVRPRQQRRFDRLGAVLDNVVSGVRRVRRRVWVFGGAGCVALLVSCLAMTLSPAPSTATEAQDETGVALPSAELEPIDAAAALLVALRSCAGDAECHAQLVDPSITALDDNATAWLPAPDAVPNVVSIMGDAVLIDVAATNPASILIARTEAGWMLRGVWPAG